MGREKGKWKETVAVGSAAFKTFHVVTSSISDYDHIS